MEETNGIKIKAKHLVRKTAEDWTARDVGTCASSIAFFFFMSMIPLLIIIFQMLPLFGLSEFDLISFLDRMIPEAMQGFAAIVVSQAYKYSKGTLSLSVSSASGDVCPDALSGVRRPCQHVSDRGIT